MDKYVSAESRWEAVLQRDSAADGSFVYAVATTGIYCRPSCSSRQPKHENVRFFDTPEQAVAAGFRPCKRCQPERTSSEQDTIQRIQQACRLIEGSMQELSLQQLADAVHLSPSHFQRTFKQVVGVTPKQYSLQKRRERLRGKLKTETSVTDSIYDAGYRSSSQFYKHKSENLGMNAKDYQNGAQGLTIRYSILSCYLGKVLVAFSERGICQIAIHEDEPFLEEHLREEYPKATLQRDHTSISSYLQDVLAYIQTPALGLQLPLDIQGTAFQRRVWQALREIPSGSTRTYKQVAEGIGKPKAARAVANACAANKLALAVPCHRVVRGDGNMGGYKWGIEKKRSILDKEVGE